MTNEILLLVMVTIVGTPPAAVGYIIGVCARFLALELSFFETGYRRGRYGKLD